MTFELRAATPADREWTYQLHRRALEAQIIRVFGAWLEDTQRGFHDVWFEPDRLLVVTVGGDDVGVLDLSVRDGAVYLSRIELEPDAQRRGTGTEVIRAVQGYARATHRDLLLQVFTTNPARALYERLGFVEEDVEGPRVRMRWHHRGGMT